MSIIDGNTPEAVAQAVRALQAGDLIGLPTETVYGLAASACNDEAVAKIYAAKGRPARHPLIVHIASTAQLPHFATDVPLFAQALANAFWPGPLTLILPRKPGIADKAAGGQDSIGLRCPSHPVAQTLLHACLQAQPAIAGLAAPSANAFGRISPTTALHVQEGFGKELLILDGGACTVGIESTIVDCTRPVPVLLRPGAITQTQIEKIAAQPLAKKEALSTPAPRAPGSMQAHYAPAATVRLMDAKTLQTALDILGAEANSIAVYARSALRTSSRKLLMQKMPNDADAAAQELFASLRAFDRQQVRLIWVEMPPDTPEWAGVRDRLMRAATAADSGSAQ